MSEPLPARAGKAERRKLEFLTVRHHVKRDKRGLMQRLAWRTEKVGDCRLYRASGSEGYPNITFRYKGKMVVMKAHRVFMILKLAGPIPLGFDVGHLPKCPNRACVKHIALQHYTLNASATNGGRPTAPDGAP